MVMKFYIQCESCLENVIIRDGYNNDDDIEIKIIGEQIIEIKCSSCNNSITTIDGKLY